MPIFTPEKLWCMPVATDTTGRLKVTMEAVESKPGAEHRFYLRTLVATIHGQRLMELRGRVPVLPFSEPLGGAASGIGLQNFCVYVGLRWDERARPPLL